MIWDYHFISTNGNEAKSFQLECSTDGGATFHTTETVSSNAPIGSGSARLDFKVPRSANFIRITITDNHFGSGAAEGGGSRVGLGEIRFITSPRIVSNTADSGPGSLRRATADASSRIFQCSVSPYSQVTVTLRSLTLTGGNAEANSGGIRV